MNKRRELVIAFGAGALAAPFGGLAQQQGKIWRIGFLWEREQSNYIRYLDAFKAGMRKLGYAEGKSYVVEQRSAGSDLARLPALSAELLAVKTDLIIPSGTPSAVAAHSATREIPILIATVGDPVRSGLAATLRRPGDNVTGLTNLATELFTKRLDLLRQIIPKMQRVGFLYNPDNDSDVLSLGQFESDCSKLKFKPQPVSLQEAQKVAAAFDTLKRDKSDGLIVSAASSNFTWRESIIEHAAKYRFPAAYSNSIFVDSGGLISYGANLLDQYRRAAAYADKIFKGAKPGDLPIEQPTKFETVINLKTAKALSVKIPQSILVQATKVIE